MVKAARIIIVMGVCGSGKSTVGVSLAIQLGIPFLDGDDYHPEDNVAKMSQGIALSDADRWPWLDALGAALVQQAQRSGAVVAACSALRRCYRERLCQATGEPILFLYLQGSRALIARRIAGRRDHFMSPALLDSQLATLEPPEPDENALTVPLGDTVPVLIDALLPRLPALPKLPSAR